MSTHPEEERRVKDLLSIGFTEITGTNRLHVGDRVHHAGQQYPGAHWDGTGNIVRMFQRTRHGGEPEIEVIVKRDEPEFGTLYGYWASYHTQLSVRQH